MSKMKKILRELGYKSFLDMGCKAWTKDFNLFRLTIAQLPVSHEYVACIVIGKTEISIPKYVNEDWLINFDKENNKP